jgi:hypothetical protein
MKKITLAIFISFFLSGVTANAAIDCTDPKGFHQKLMCKKQKMAENKSLKKSNKTSSVTENDSGSVTDKGKNILKKIKNPFKKFNDWSKAQKKTIF